jgi:DNA gyrase/topoisomerase IV subunit B
VNALSEWLEVEVCRDGQVHHQVFERGVPQAPELEVIGKTPKTGTKVTFLPDMQIFHPRADSSGTSSPRVCASWPS